MRRRKFPKVIDIRDRGGMANAAAHATATAISASGVLEPIRIGWFTWKKKDGKRAQPHAFRVLLGKRQPKTLCHNAPGVAAGEVVEVEPSGDRCASCDEAVRRKGGVRRGNSVPAAARPPRRHDPRTLYEPVHTFDDWDRDQ